MAECVLDANVLVAYIDEADSLHSLASELLEKLSHQGHEPQLLDIIVSETVSVLCRRFEQRGRSADFPAALTHFRSWIDFTTITWVASEAERRR